METDDKECEIPCDVSNDIASVGTSSVNTDSVHGITSSVRDMDIDSTTVDLTDLSDVPNVLIVKNLDEQIFMDQTYKVQFEALFKEYDSAAQFQYLKSFRRARVVLQDGVTATKCRLYLQNIKIGNSGISCYFQQPLKRKGGESSPHLHPPIPEKQFLISPPASPPVGWEAVEERDPGINYDLLSAMAQLAPGEAHELHPGSSNQPGIVVHVCEDPAGYKSNKIAHTKRPTL